MAVNGKITTIWSGKYIQYYSSWSFKGFEIYNFSRNGDFKISIVNNFQYWTRHVQNHLGVTGGSNRASALILSNNITRTIFSVPSHLIWSRLDFVERMITDPDLSKNMIIIKCYNVSNDSHNFRISIFYLCSAYLGAIT